MMQIARNIETLKACRFCPMCRHVCTSGNISLHESDYPRGRGLILDNILEERMKYGPDLVQAVYNCCLCGICWSNCEGGYMPHQLVLSSRKDIAGTGPVPEEVKKIVKKVESGKNPYGRPSNIFQGKNRKADILYFMGDYIKFNDHSIAGSVINIMEKAGDDYSIMAEEPTDGKVLALLGYEDRARIAAESLNNRFKDLAPGVILVSDPLSYDCLRNDFPAYGLETGIEVIHVSEYLEDIIRKKKIRVKKTNKTITLADSEFLGRFNNVFDPPRQVLKAAAGDRFVEMARNRKYALATGEAAFLFNGKPQGMAEIIGSRICVEAEYINAGVIVTLSGIAKKNLQGCNSMGIFEISEYIWQNIN